MAVKLDKLTIADKAAINSGENGFGLFQFLTTILVVC